MLIIWELIILNAGDFRKAIKNNELKGGYLFYGDEEYMKRFCLNELRKNILSDENDIFNHIKITDENFSYNLLNDSIISLPVFNDKKFIEVHSLDLMGMKENELELFSAIISESAKYDHTILVIYMSAGSFDAGTERAPTKIFTKLCKLLTPVAFEYETPVKLIKWIQQHFAAEKILIEPEICKILVDNIGQSMTALKTEIEKLSAYVLYNNKNKITADDINNITIHNKIINQFDFTNAVLERDNDKIFYILTDMKLKKEKPEIILSQVSRVYDDLFVIKTLYNSGLTQKMIAAEIKMHEYRVGIYLKHSHKYSIENIKYAIEACFSADKKIKNTSSDNYLVLELLLLNLVNIK